MTATALSTVGAVLKGIVAGKSVQTLDRSPVGNELAILKVSAVTWGEFRPNECKAMPADYEPGDCPRAMDGDILISRANTRELVGAPVMVQGDHPNLLLSDKLLKLIPDERLVKREYLVRALRSPSAVQHFAQCAGGTSGSMTNITQENIRQTPIRIPGLPEQRRIAAILDQADALRSQRRQALAELDTLSRAVFVEMFGEFGAGSVRWPDRPLGELMTDSTIGLVRAADEFGPDFDVPYVRMNAIGRGGAFLPDLVQRTKADLDEQKRFALKPGDLLFNTRNSRELVGKTALFREQGLYVFNNNVMRIRFNDAVHSEYVAAAFQTPFIQQELETRKAGTTSVFAIYARELKTIPMPIPPRVMQDAFAERIQAIESIKAMHRSALTESDALFSSLQYRAFTGAL